MMEEYIHAVGTMNCVFLSASMNTRFRRRLAGMDAESHQNLKICSDWSLGGKFLKNDIFNNVKFTTCFQIQVTIIRQTLGSTEQFYYLNV
jgi:hypothetical protein